MGMLEKETEDNIGRAKDKMVEIVEGRLLWGVQGGDKTGFGQ